MLLTDTLHTFNLPPSVVSIPVFVKAKEPGYDEYKKKKKKP